MMKSFTNKFILLSVFCLCFHQLWATNSSVLQNDKYQNNVDSFWTSTRLQLSLIPMDAKISPIADALPYLTYKITLQSLGSVKFVALLSLPVQGEEKVVKPWPVIITAPGFGGKQQGVMLSECQRGYAILQVFPRGQGESAELYKIKGNQLIDGIENPDSAYYRSAYADVMRTIDYVFTRKDLDHKRIALVGTSQGGGICLAVGSIDHRIKTIVAHVPFLCNFEMATKINGSLVKSILDKAGKNTTASITTLDYFDPLFLVPKLKIPTLISAGGADTTCPYKTIQSVYALITSKKELKFYPNLKHSSSLDFYKNSWLWLSKNL